MECGEECEKKKKMMLDIVATIVVASQLPTPDQLQYQPLVPTFVLIYINNPVVLLVRIVKTPPQLNSTLI